MDENGILSTILGQVSEHWGLVSGVGSAAALLGASGFAFLRRPKEHPEEEGDFLADEKLLTPPTARPAYSDRMAYVLAELSGLAYFKFEGPGGAISDSAKIILDAATRLTEVPGGNEQKHKEWLDGVFRQLLVGGAENEAALKSILDGRGFDLLGTINVAGTQGFVCKRRVKENDGHCFIAVAFRGTQKKVSDWLTNADAVPMRIGEKTRLAMAEPKKVHSGFRKALAVTTDSSGKTAIDHVREIIARDGKDESGEQLPVFLTGHSLGGALALLTTAELDRDICGACYTFGAPRVANYEYFDNIKTPVFRVVNSSDIVPRVPPIMIIWVKLFQGMEWLTSYFLPPVSRLSGKFSKWLDKLEGYRHYGDMRYLTDVKSGRFSDVKLLHNPPLIDRIMWVGQQLGQSLFSPVQSHSMVIYRKKLQFLANERNRTH